MILHGNALDQLKNFPDNFFSAVVTDPPYGLSKEPDIKEVLHKWLAGEPYDHKHGGFMGKEWDSFVPHPEIWEEVHRVLKPGGHALIFAGTRTQDLMTIALRLAGFEVRDVIEWLYFSGFPKGLDISKALDKRQGHWRGKAGKVISENGSMSGGNYERTPKGEPVTELAKVYDGWNTALKPAHEPIIMVRKPLGVGNRRASVVANVEEHGTGGINIDDCRIGERFPMNCATLDDDQFYSEYFNITPKELSKKASKKDRNSDWRGHEIDLEEREAGGLQGRSDGSLGSVTYNRNIHPTVKPVDLMKWLVQLVTPPGGVVLDPFAGSGTTLVAAKALGFPFVGIELNEEYVEIINARVQV